MIIIVHYLIRVVVSKRKCKNELEKLFQGKEIGIN
jgi:hypothetical protein